MIVRIWDGMTLTTKAEAYETYLQKTGIPDYKSTPGNLDVLVLVRQEGEVTHFKLITFWESMDAIQKFAGDPVDAARYYPEDAEYLLEMNPKVEHYEVVPGAWGGLLPGSTGNP